MTGIADLYGALRADNRLQQDWESNQPRVDRALESPLIAITAPMPFALTTPK